MKWIKRILVLLLVLVIGLGIMLGISYHMIHRVPTWYKPLAMGSAEMEAAAGRAFNKVVAIHNMADQAPDRVMREDETVAALLRLGFATVDIPYRDNLQAVLVASKPKKNSETTERSRAADCGI